MRLILDTNQGNSVRFSYQNLPREHRPPLVIPPLVWAELVLGGGNDARRRALAKFDLLFGMDMGMIFDELARKNEEQIRQFIPIRNDNRHTREQVLFNFQYPTHEHRRVAQQIRDEAIRHRDTFGPYLQQVRRRNRDAVALANQRGEPGPDFVEWANIISNARLDMPMQKVESGFRVGRSGWTRSYARLQTATDDFSCM